MPWIHLDDYVKIFINAISDANYDRIINAVSPSDTTAAEIASKVAKLKNGWGLVIPVPNFAVKLMLGEVSTVALSSYKSKNTLLKHLGLKYDFADIDSCLEDIFNIYVRDGKRIMNYRFNQVQFCG